MDLISYSSIDEQALHEAGLRYVSCRGKGYQRIHTANGFSYVDLKGNTIHNPKVLARIQSLVIPPAWQLVWICPFADGHIQATGVDARARKQYRYHPLWTRLRSQDKFSGLYTFGQRLSRLEKQIIKDLKRTKLSRDRICALALAIMSKTYFRIGNSVYERENKSYGLTTLRNHHVKQISTQQVFFRFIGKKGIQQQSFLREKTLIRLLAKVKEIPGQRLFQYYDDQGQPTALESGDLNNYMKAAIGIDMTCKTLRTWYASILALHYLGQQIIPTSERERKQKLLDVIDGVAKQLGNTRTVTRNHYIHPYIQELYLVGKLDPWISRMNKRQKLQPADPVYKRRLMQLLRSANP